MIFPISGAHIPPLWLIGVGFIIGVLGGFFGVGGSFLAGPALFAFGVPMNFVVGTDLAHIVGKSIVAAKTHRVLGNVDIKLGLIMAFGTIAGVECGAQMIQRLKQSANVDRVVAIVFVIVLVSIAAFIAWETWLTSRLSHRQRRASQHGKSDASALSHIAKRLHRIHVPPMVRLPVSGIEQVSLWTVLAVAFVGGIFSGFLGGGAGYIRMPALVYLLGVPTHIAVGTDLFEVVISASYGTWTHAIKGNVDILIALVMHTGAAIGAQIGANLTQYFHGPRIRLAFVPLPLLGAAVILYSLWTGTSSPMKMLFCTDGSAAAEQAVRFGAPLAAACQVEPTVLGITEDPQQQAAIWESLGRAQVLLREHHLNAELITKVGRPVVEIVRRTQETAYDLVVIGATRKGTGGPRWMSARAYRIIEAVAPPVLVALGNRTNLRRILLCTGGATHADGAVKFTAEIARRLGAAVTLFHVAAEPPAIYADLLERQEDLTRLLSTGSALGRGLQHHQQLLAAVGVAVELHVRHGLVMDELLTELAQGDYDLVVAGSSPTVDPVRRYVLPNLTREIVNRAERPVLVVRSGPAPRAQPLSDRLRHLFHPTEARAGKPGAGAGAGE